MNFIRNLLALIGLVAIIGGAYNLTLKRKMFTPICGKSSRKAAIQQTLPW